MPSDTEIARLAAMGNSLNGEDWKPVLGYETTYRVSTLGRVWSIARPTTPGGLLKWSPDGYGYPRVMLCQGGTCIKRRVHLIVMAAFVGPTPDGMEIRHRDGDAGNPALTNLEFGTHAQNMRDMVLHGRSAKRDFCRRGHPRIEGNLGAPTNSGSRPCLACRREARRAQ